MGYLRYTIISILLLVTSLLFDSCNSEDEEFKIGVSHCDNSDWISQMNYEITQEAKFCNFNDIEFLSAAGDCDIQIEQISKLIDKDVDALIVTPTDPERLNPILSTAYDKGIILVVFGEVVGDKYSSLVAMNDKLLGSVAGDKANNIVKSGGTIIELRSANNPLNSRSIEEQIHTGFTAKIEPSAEVVSIDFTDNLDRVERCMDSLCRHYPKIDVILSYTAEISDVVARRVDKLSLEGIVKQKPQLWSIQTQSLGSDLQRILDKKIDALFIYTPGGNALIGQIFNAHTGIAYKRNLLGGTTVADTSNCGILRNQFWNLIKRSNQINKLDAQISDSAEKSQQQRYMLLAVSLFSILLIAVVAFILKLLTLKQNKNLKLEVEKSQILKQNKQLEVKIRMSNEHIDEPTSQDQKFIDQVNEMIKKHLSDPNFGVDQMCDELCYSRVQVYRKVKELTGESPAKLLRIARIKHGHHLLHTTDMSIAKIACEVGYVSSSYFSKYYKEMYGVLPSDISKKKSE